MSPAVPKAFFLVLMLLDTSHDRRLIGGLTDEAFPTFAGCEKRAPSYWDSLGGSNYYDSKTGRDGFVVGIECMPATDYAKWQSNPDSWDFNLSTSVVQSSTSPDIDPQAFMVLLYVDQNTRVQGSREFGNDAVDLLKCEQQARKYWYFHRVPNLVADDLETPVKAVGWFCLPPDEHKKWKANPVGYRFDMNNAAAPTRASALRSPRMSPKQQG